MARLSRRRDVTVSLYQVHYYSWPGSYSKKALPQATVFSLGPVNWGVVYLTVFSLAVLGPLFVLLREHSRLRDNPAQRLFDLLQGNILSSTVCTTV